MTSSSSKRILYLHVGHGKTGSSFVQSSLALSTDALSTAGISYPSSPKDHERAIAGHVNRGNFPPLEKGRHLPEQIEGILSPEMWGGHDRLLLSNEALFGSILRYEFLDHLMKHVDDRDIDVKILCFIRNPLDSALSSYQQKLKEGNLDTASDFIRKFNVPRQVGTFLDLLEAKSVDLTIVNYSTSKTRLIDRVADWLNIDAENFSTPERDSVNRSMTRAEMEFQRAFSAHVGPLARLFVSDALSNALPNIRSEKPFIEDEAIKDFLSRMKIFLSEVNPRLPESERYDVPSFGEIKQSLPTEEEADNLSLSREQIDVLARSMAKWFKKPGQRPRK